MLIGDQSPFFRLSAGLPQKQILFYDGIRYAVLTAEYAYIRLREKLFELMQARNKGLRAQDIYLYNAPALLDAWGVVDGIQRLRKLLQRTPGLKQKSPELGIFYRATATIEDLRHVAQHLDERVDGMVARHLPVWGQLTWLYKPGDDPNDLWTCQLVPGARQEGWRALVNPAGKALLHPIDHVTLEADGVSVSLSSSMAQLERLVRWIESELTGRLPGGAAINGDMFVCAHFDGHPKESRKAS